MQYTTRSGLVITDRRHQRASEVPQIDPAEHTPNANDPLGDVGPQFTPGDPTQIVGWHAEGWSGWPTGWDTPWMTDAYSGYGYARNPIINRVSTAMTCVDLNSRQLASFPRYGLRGDDERFNLPAWSDNPEPELYAGWGEFMHSTVNCLLIAGEAFQYCTQRDSRGFPARFVNLNPWAVAPELIDGRIEYLVDGVPVNRDDVCHTKYQSWPGRLRGISPLEWASRSLVTAEALERYAANLATRGGIPWAVLKSQRNISGKQATDAQNAWVTAAANRMGAPAVIGNAFELETLTFSPRDMALLELREFDERRICAAFGVPGYLVNVAQADGLTYTNAAQLTDHHWRTTLRPLCQLLAESWSAWLLPRGSIMEFDPDRYTQPDLATRATTYATLFAIQDPVTGERAMYIEEIRDAERMPDVEPPEGPEEPDVPAAVPAPPGTPAPSPLTGWEEG